MPFSAVTYECFLCSRSFKFGPDDYEGQFIAQWDMMVCDPCYNASRDGIKVEKQEQVLAHLEALGIKPKIDELGRIAIP